MPRVGNTQQAHNSTIERLLKIEIGLWILSTKAGVERRRNNIYSTRKGKEGKERKHNKKNMRKLPICQSWKPLLALCVRFCVWYTSQPLFCCWYRSADFSFSSIHLFPHIIMYIYFQFQIYKSIESINSDIFSSPLSRLDEVGFQGW